MNNTEYDILVIQHQPIISGSIQSMLLLIKHLRRNNYRVKVLFLQSKGNALELFQKEGIAYITTDSITTYAHAYGAYRKFFSRRPWRPITMLISTFQSVHTAKTILQEQRPKLVYLNTSVLIPFAIAAKQLDIKVVWHLREQIHKGIFGFRKKMFQYLFQKYSNSIIAISKVNAKSLGVKSVDIIYNSVDFRVFNHQLRNNEWEEKYGLKDKIVISFVGGNNQVKGADQFIKMAVVLKKSFGDDIRFMIAGHFNLNPLGFQNRVDKLVHKLILENNLSENVIFTGVLPNISPLLSISTILVWSANEPHFARPIVEAMAMGVPVVATNFDSSREIIIDRIDGLLAEKNYINFAHTVTELLNDRNLYQKIKTNSIIKAKQLFDADGNNELILKIIQKNL